MTPPPTSWFPRALAAAVASVCILMAPPTVVAADDEPAKGKDGKDGEAEAKPVEEKRVETKHEGTFGGRKLSYTATAGTLVLKKDEEEPHASVFFVAYTEDGTTDPADRPIVFCFNGGPGSSAVWLHLGGFGPKRVAMNPDGTQPKPPYRLEPNPESLLAVADLVFIDPVSTGFSRAEPGEKASDFHGFDEDLASVAEFIRLYTTRHARWASPKFLAGESYGAFRAAGLADVLQNRSGMYLNGIVLVSGLLSFETLRDTDVAHIGFLPSLASVAKFHGKLDDDLAALAEPELMAEVEAFAKGDYALALLHGAGLPEARRKATALRLAMFTGLDPDLVERLDLRIPPSRFREELLREEGKVVGRFDARIVGEDGDRAGDAPGYDPSYTAVYGAFAATMKDYVRRELKFESDLSYEILTRKVQPWNYDAFTGSYPQVANKLASALTDNPDLHIFVACGYHDLATPHAAIRHSLDHLDVAPSRHDNIQIEFYPGGHMMYTIETVNAELNRDIAAFIQASRPDTP